MSSTESAAPGAYEISPDPTRLDVAAIHAYLTRSYWSPGIPIGIVERALRQSLCFGIYESAGGAQVGLARVVTDYATFAAPIGPANGVVDGAGEGRPRTPAGARFLPFSISSWPMVPGQRCVSGPSAM